MLFNSQLFILGFLPVALALYYALAGQPRGASGVADRGVAGPLRLVGRPLRAAADGADAGQLAARRSGSDGWARAGSPLFGRGAEPRGPRAVQIRRLPARHRVRPRGSAVDALAPDPAARHQLLRVPEDLLSGRSAPRRPAHLRVPRFLPVRVVLPATDRRSRWSATTRSSTSSAPTPGARTCGRTSAAASSCSSIGVAKKVALADSLAQVADPLFARSLHAHASGPRRVLGRRRWPTRCKSTSISPDIPTWRSGWR